MIFERNYLEHKASFKIEYTFQARIKDYQNYEIY